MFRHIYDVLFDRDLVLCALEIVQRDAVVIQHLQHVLPVFLGDSYARGRQYVVGDLTEHQVQRQRTVERFVRRENLLFDPQGPRDSVVREMRGRRLRIEFGVHHLLDLLDFRFIRGRQYRFEELRPLLDLDPLHLVGAMSRRHARSPVHLPIELVETLPRNSERFPRVRNDAEIPRRRHPEAVAGFWRHIPSHAEMIALTVRTIERVLRIEEFRVNCKIAARIEVGATIARQAREIGAVLPVKILRLGILRARFFIIVSIIDVIVAQMLLRSEDVSALTEHLTLGEVIEGLGVRRCAERVASFRLDRRWW